MNQIDIYIKQFPTKVQEELHKIRQLIKTNAPDAEEMISYGMPGYKIKKSLWFILLLIKITSGCMQRRQVIHSLKMNFQYINKAKAQFNFHLINLYHIN